MLLNFQIHKYKNGHQLVASTTELGRSDQDTIDRLSDISGQLRPGEVFAPYFTCYSVPSEKYFVIARTWQDLSAPRAGCVLTKSIIIEMKDWENSPMVYSFFNALLISNFDMNFPNISMDNRMDIIKQEIDGPIEELIESLFLEQRKPILIFDCCDEEQIIMRLYKVLWPNLRNKFAVCTFALAPRSVNNRPFDLLFSSSIMRTRFSDWKGRRIEGASVNRKSARHRWTRELTDRIFKNKVPQLYDKSELSLFNYIQNVDESTLRLSLLWDELLNKAKFESSPIAILGLLDIINSQTIFANALYKNLEPYILSAINNAYDELDPNEAWKFYAGLLVKHKRKLMGREMLFQVKSACISLTTSNPEVAIEFIADFNPSSESIPSMLYASIGIGLSKSYFDNFLSLVYNKIPPNLGLKLLAASREYAKMIMDFIQDGESHLNKNIEISLRDSNTKALQRAKVNLMHYVRTPSHFNVLITIIVDATEAQFLRILKTLAINTKFAFREFDSIILQASEKFKAFDFLMRLVVIYADRDKGDELLVKLFVLYPELIIEYLSTHNISSITKSNVICETFNRVPNSQLSHLYRNRKLSKELLSVLVNNNKCIQEKLAEFILISDLIIGEALESFNRLHVDIINSVSQDSLLDLIRRSFTITTPNSLIPVLEKLNQAQSDFLVFRLFDSRIEIDNIKIIFETLLNASMFKKSMTRHVDVVSEMLAKQLPDNISNEFAEGWIELLHFTNDSDKRRRASFEMLGYVFRKNVTDPTSLILTSFPIVYGSFLQGKTLAKSIVYWVFTDWDKCRTLRYDLVDRYLNSKWPLLGLFQVAKKSGILKDIVYILSNSKKGKLFMKLAYGEILNAPHSADKAIMKELKHHIKEK